MEGLMLEYAVRTHVGHVRSHNEDAVFASPRLAAVADGVGGAAAGEIASRLVINALAYFDSCRLEGSLEDALETAIARGNHTIAFVAGCRPGMSGMSTTLTAVALGDDGYVLANVGDSRTYLLRDNELMRLTRDDTLVQLLVDSEGITPAQAREHPQRSVVLEALDGDPQRTPTMTTLAARLDDRLLLCSDGLSDMVGDEDLAAALRNDSRDACADELVDRALRAGGRDNISAIVADVTRRRDPAAAWKA